jgi:uncharacterized membrane protein (UPF0127 family)
MNQTRWTAQIVPDPDNPEEWVLDLGDELCQQLGWKVGDTLIWQQQGEGQWLLTPQSSTTPPG